MEKEFVTYELALRMKHIKSVDKGFRYGFNEKTFAYFVEGYPNKKLVVSNKSKLYSYEYNGGGPELISAPLYQQAFRWFREKYGFNCMVDLCTTPIDFTESITTYYYKVNGNRYDDLFHKTYEEAELACLEKLIDIVENQ